MCMLSRTSTEEYSVSVSLVLSLISVTLEMIFSVTGFFCPWISTMSENLNISSLERPFAIEKSA